MKILYAASEARPFIATGGLADVAGSLPRALNDNETECRVVIPLYGDIPQHFREKMTYLTNFEVQVSWRRQYCGVFQTVENGVTYYLIDNEYYFKRPGCYGFYDDAERFAFFSHAVLEMLSHIDFKPDILHANDWHTALVPVFYDAFYAGLEGYRNMKTVFTIHNVQFQGKYGHEILSDVLGVPDWAYNILEYDQCVNFMKGAVVSAAAVTAVSPTYAQELTYPFYSYGLDPIFKLCAGKLSGILNGIDNTAYDPENDPALFKSYSAKDLSGKAENRRGLQRMLGLPEEENALIVGMVTRLTEQKGIELVKFVLEEMLSDHLQFVLLGTGDWSYENYFSLMQKQYPGRMAVRIGFMNDLAHKIYAGADVLLMPSKTEPCGLAQMVALRYGTIPVVRETGGLGDSIIDCGNENGYGYTFKSFNAHDMLGAVRRAEGAFCNRNYWNAIKKRAMEKDFSWKQSAGEYRRLYAGLL